MLTKLSSPTVTPISLSEARRHLGVTDDSHDTDILDLIIAATNMFRRWVGRELLSCQYRLSLACFPSRIELPYPPLVSIQSVKYRDTAGVEQTMATTDYQIASSDAVPAWLFPGVGKTWPVVQDGRVDAVNIEFTAGYGDTTATVPPEAKQFIKLLIRHWFDNPSAVGAAASKEVELACRSIAASLGTGFYADV